MANSAIKAQRTTIALLGFVLTAAFAHGVTLAPSFQSPGKRRLTW